MTLTDYTHSKDDTELLLRALRLYADVQDIPGRDRNPVAAKHARELAQIIDDGFETVTRDTQVPS